MATQVNDLEEMRARELRNFLIQTLGIERSKVLKILDRKELKELAKNELTKRIILTQRDSFLLNIAKYAGFLGVIFLLVIFRVSIISFLFNVMDFIKGIYGFRFQRKVNMMKICWEHFLFFPGFVLTLGIITEIFDFWIHLSVFLGWILPRTSRLRDFFAPMLYVPLSTPTNMWGKADGHHNSDHQLGLNVGPMVTLWLTRWLSNKLEDFGAVRILKHNGGKVNNNSKRRKLKLQENTFPEINFNSTEIFNIVDDGSDRNEHFN